MLVQKMQHLAISKQFRTCQCFVLSRQLQSIWLVVNVIVSFVFWYHQKLIVSVQFNSTWCNIVLLHCIVAYGRLDKVQYRLDARYESIYTETLLFYLFCDCKWHKINFLDDIFHESMVQNFGFGSGRNKDGVSKTGVNKTGSWGVESGVVCDVQKRVFQISFPIFWIALARP